MGLVLIHQRSDDERKINNIQHYVFSSFCLQGGGVASSIIEAP